MHMDIFIKHVLRDCPAFASQRQVIDTAVTFATDSVDELFFDQSVDDTGDPATGKRHFLSKLIDSDIRILEQDSQTSEFHNGNAELCSMDALFLLTVGK